MYVYIYIYSIIWDIHVLFECTMTITGIQYDMNHDVKYNRILTNY